MRMQQFFEIIKSYDFGNAEFLASHKAVNGGWEVWLQVELAGYLYNAAEEQNNFYMEREKIYPSVRGYRCDFFISYNGGRDGTYIELKCTNPFHASPVRDAFDRLNNDIQKQTQVREPGFCLLAFYGTGQDIIDNRRVWGGGYKTCIILDCCNEALCDMDALNDYPQSLYLIGVSR